MLRITGLERRKGGFNAINPAIGRPPNPVKFQSPLIDHLEAGM